MQCWAPVVQTNRCHPALTGLSSELPVDCLHVVTLRIINGSSRSYSLISGDKISRTAGSCSSFFLTWLILSVPQGATGGWYIFFLYYHSEILTWCFCVRFGDGPKVLMAIRWLRGYVLFTLRFGWPTFTLWQLTPWSIPVTRVLRFSIAWVWFLFVVIPILRPSTDTEKELKSLDDFVAFKSGHPTPKSGCTVLVERLNR